MMFFGTDAWRVFVPRIRSSPIGKYRCRRSSKASWFQWSFQFVSASHAGLWHCKTNPMLHLVKTKPKKGNNNLDRTNLHEKWQFFWAMKQISTFRWEVAAEIKFLRRIWRPFFDMSCFLLHLGSWKKERDNEGWNKSSTSHDHYSIGKK